MMKIVSYDYTALIMKLIKPVLRIRIRTDRHSFLSAGSGSALGIRIRIQEGQNYPQKGRKFKFLNARCSLLKDEDFCCRLDVLFGGLGISKLQFSIKNFFFSCKYFPIYGHQNPGSGSGSGSVSGSALKPMRIRNTE
jgi:hypothetical protein